MTRQDKKRDKARRIQLCRKRYWQRIADSLGVIGLGDWFNGLGDRLKAQLGACSWPLPEFVTEQLGHVGQEVRKEIRQDLANATVPVGEQNVSWEDAYRILCPLLMVIQDTDSIKGSLTVQELRYFDHAQLVRDNHLQSIIDTTFAELANVVLSAVGTVSAFDLRLSWLQIDRPILYGLDRRGHRFTCAAERPQSISLTLDGSARTAHRCGGVCGSEFKWVSLSIQGFDQTMCQKDYPVYIQKHALNRLEERLHPLDHSSIYWSTLLSLDKPIVTEGRNKDSYLIEFRLGEQVRVGYLVAKLMPDKIVITTFLFLTMQGTPEAYHLFDRLRLRRPDIEYNRMDSLQSFFNSDIKKDPDLALDFKEAGCGDLLRLVCDGLPAGALKSATLRRYLGLGPSRPSDPVTTVPATRPGSRAN
jgi:hypothetical protein